MQFSIFGKISGLLVFGIIANEEEKKVAEISMIFCVQLLLTST